MQGTDADYIGISQVGRLVAVDQSTIAISNLVELKSMTNERIKEKLPPRLARRFEPPANGVYRVFPRLWNGILKIAASSPKTRRRVREQQQAVAEAGRPNRRIEGGLEVFARNAIASALEVFGGLDFEKEYCKKQWWVGPRRMHRSSVGLRQWRFVRTRRSATIRLLSRVWKWPMPVRSDQWY